MLATNTDPRKKINKAAVSLLLRHPFFGSLLYRHEVLITTSVETAAVSVDRVIMLNPEFVQKCSPAQLEFLLAHEVMHIVFAHIARRGDRDPVIYNIACDAVINETLIVEGVGEFIEGGIRMLGAQYRTSESIYDEIAPKLKPRKKTSPSKGQGLTLPLFPNGLGANGQAGVSENDDSSGSNSPFIGKLNIPDLPRQARQLTQEEINEQIEEGKIELGQALTTARTCGNMSGVLGRFINSILESSLPWYQILERYMAASSRPKRAFSHADCHLGKRWENRRLRTDIPMRSNLSIRFCRLYSNTLRETAFRLLHSQSTTTVKRMHPSSIRCTSSSLLNQCQGHCLFLR